MFAPKDPSLISFEASRLKRQAQDVIDVLREQVFVFIGLILCLFLCTVGGVLLQEKIQLQEIQWCVWNEVKIFP